VHAKTTTSYDTVENALSAKVVQVSARVVFKSLCKVIHDDGSEGEAR
jgi:hypothetical protein